MRDPCLSQGRREHVSSAPSGTQARPCGPDARGAPAWKSCWVQGPLPTRVAWEATQAGPSLPHRGRTAQICTARAKGSAVHTAQPRVGSCVWPPSHRLSSPSSGDHDACSLEFRLTEARVISEKPGLAHVL